MRISTRRTDSRSSVTVILGTVKSILSIQIKQSVTDNSLIGNVENEHHEHILFLAIYKHMLEATTRVFPNMSHRTC